MEILGGLGRKADSRGKTREVKKITYMDYFKNRKYREEKDPMAMDIDAMSTEKRITLMRKGACFICEKPGHLVAHDHNEYMKKERKENAQGSTSFAPKKKNISEIHALPQALSTEETKELLALQNKAEEKKDDDEDF